MEVVNTTTTINPVNMYDYVNSYFSNPIVITTVLLVIIAYFVLSSSLGNSAPGAVNGNMDAGSSIMEFIVIAILVVLIAINAFQYFFSINITAFIQGLFTPKTTVDIVVDQSTYQSGAAPSRKLNCINRCLTSRGIITIMTTQRHCAAHMARI